MHSICHVVFLLAAGPALWSTVLALREQTRRRLLAVGLLHLWHTLARWEALLFFVIATGILLCAMYAGKTDFRALRMGLFAVLGFAALFVPATTSGRSARSRYGIWGPSAITTFYIFFTAGSCGPCRFGMYESEYRLALQNAGYERFAW